MSRGQKMFSTFWLWACNFLFFSPSLSASQLFCVLFSEPDILFFRPPFCEWRTLLCNYLGCAFSVACSVSSTPTADTHTHTDEPAFLIHTHMPPQLEVHSCCCLPCRDQKNILYSSPGENLPSHNKHEPSAQFEAPLWVVSVAIKAKVPSSSPAWWTLQYVVD